MLVLICSITSWLSSCKPKHICPAYQSAFYLDPKLADIEFGPFDKDSMPKLEETVKKTDVLLVLRLGKKKIDKRMAVIPMITIFPEQADSALAMADSMGSDSTFVEDAPESDESEITDSTQGTQETPETPEIEDPEPEIQEKATPKKQLPIEKQKKKTDLKDPELSDPSMKAEFEESFEDAPSNFDLNEPLPEEEAPPVEEAKPIKKKKGTKKQDRKPLTPVKKEPAPTEEDKF